MRTCLIVLALALATTGCKKKAETSAVEEEEVQGHPDLQCPDGTQPMGKGPPHDEAAYCVKVSGADITRHGPAIEWHGNGKRAAAGEYHEGVNSTVEAKHRLNRGRKQNEISYFETSAKEGVGVDAAFIAGLLQQVQRIGHRLALWLPINQVIHMRVVTFFAGLMPEQTGHHRAMRGHCPAIGENLRELFPVHRNGNGLP